MVFIGKLKSYIKKSEYFIHETKKSVITKFLLILSIFLVYLIFVSFKYGLSQGFIVTILTWSFFVFCTPIADAGFLFDFPMRLITGLKMVYSEILVWGIAFFINFVAVVFNHQIYEKTLILRIFDKILLNPYPFWSIIILSAAGTFLSVYFGDELIDVVNHRDRKKHKEHKNKYRFILILFLMSFILFLYDILLKEAGIHF